MEVGMLGVLGLGLTHLHMGGWSYMRGGHSPDPSPTLATARSPTTSCPTSPSVVQVMGVTVAPVRLLGCIVCLCIQVRAKRLFRGGVDIRGRSTSRGRGAGIGHGGQGKSWEQGMGGRLKHGAVPAFLSCCSFELSGQALYALKPEVLSP